MTNCEADKSPDLDHFDYHIANPQANSRITAWSKLKECERRIAFYKWAEGKNDARTPQNRVLLNDTVSAFLMTFEATIQFLKDQFKTIGINEKFEDWLQLAMRKEDLILVNGLRTIRHFEAHIEAKPTPRRIKVSLGESIQDETSIGFVTCDWVLPSITPSDLGRLRTPPLKLSDLDDWKGLVAKEDAPSLFFRGVQALKIVLEEAESLIQQKLQN
jgi:hypothetical protein